MRFVSTKHPRVVMAYFATGEVIPGHHYARQYDPRAPANSSFECSRQEKAIKRILDDHLARAPGFDKVYFQNNISGGNAKRKCQAETGREWVCLMWQDIEPWGNEELSP